MIDNPFYVVKIFREVIIVGINAEEVGIKRSIEEIVENIEELIDEHRMDDLRKYVLGLKPYDLVDVLERLDSNYRRKLIGIIPGNYYVEILPRLSEDLLYEVVMIKGVSKVARAIAEMQPDVIADILEKLPVRIRRQVIALLPPWKVEEVAEILKYPPESAGGVMTTRIPIFSANETVGRALEKYLVKYQLGLYDRLEYVYVVESNGKLIGWIDLKKLMASSKDKLLKDIVQPIPAKVHVLADREEAARLVIKYDLTEIPVIDEDGRLLGVITVDDIIDVIVAESTEDILKFGGIGETVRGSYLTARVTELARRRATWLIVLYLLESITVSVISSFEHVISSLVALSFFIPLLTATGGNAGSQAATLVIRSLATGEAHPYDFLRILGKELLSSTLLALTVAPVGFLVALMISHKIFIAFIVAVALPFIIIVASLMGVLLPFIAMLIKADPAVISAPLISTISDITGLTIYFTIAALLLHSLGIS